MSATEEAVGLLVNTVYENRNEVLGEGVISYIRVKGEYKCKVCSKT